MKSKIIPFGKYKGLPIESLAEDKNYLNWLLAQSWFPARHKDLHAIIINNFHEPSETPEHNKLQALFLDNDFCNRFMDVALQQATNFIYERVHIWFGQWFERELFISKSVKKPSSEVIERSFEFKGIDVHLKSHFNCIGLKFNDENLDLIQSPTQLRVSKIFKIEIKPSLGDDYPSVLRYMQTQRVEILFVDEYNGKGASIEELIKIFNNQKIAVVLKKNLN